MPTEPAVEDLLRQLAPQVLAALARGDGDFAACEDAVQEALLAASQQWPVEGVPGNPRGWRIAEAGARFAPPAPDELDERLDAVRRVLYLVFNEGYSAASGAELQRRDLAADGIRLARRLLAARPDDAESAGLLALMLLTEARHAARVGPTGELVPLAEQDRSRWDRALIDEGVALLLATLPRGRIGPYQLQAAIAGVHDEAASVDDTDWVEVLGLYDLLQRVDPSPVVALNRAVAVGMVHGPAAGLAVVDALAADGRLAGHHRLHVVRAHLLERAGDVDGARAELAEAVRRTTSVPERRHLERRVRELG